MENFSLKNFLFLLLAFKNLSCEVLSATKSEENKDSLSPLADQYLKIPLDRLPPNKEERQEILESYFPEHLPTATEEGENWTICLERPSSPYESYLYDETLREGLNWWKEGTRVRDIPFEYQLFEKGILAIEDQWIPLSWANYFKNLGSLPKEVILLHIDDHQDLMSPRLGLSTQGSFIDLITELPLSFMDPESVRSAILSGSIGKGSILTPLLFSVDKVHLRHLSLRETSDKDFILQKKLIKNDLLGGDIPRIAVELVETSSKEIDQKSTYKVTNDPQRWIQDLPLDPKIPILLHIDVDFFNNRFDGCSDWKMGQGRSHDLPLDDQKEYLQQIVKSLKSAQMIPLISDISIGISAGFYPGEYWGLMVPLLLETFPNIGKMLS